MSKRSAISTISDFSLANPPSKYGRKKTKRATTLVPYIALCLSLLLLVSFLVNLPSGEREEEFTVPAEDDGIYFPQVLEKFLPQGFTQSHINNWAAGVRMRHVVRVTVGCGRMMNRLLTLDDGSRVCCRYRHNQDQVQGELYSYYLSRVLGINKVAPTMLAVVNFTSPFWSSVQDDLVESGWTDGKLVILTQHIAPLQPVHIPHYYHESSSSQVLTSSHLVNITRPGFIDLFQWSDTILFDYLTGNLDRIVNNLHNLQWDPRMLKSPIHNLEKREDGMFLLFDNESGLLHSYRLMDKYQHYHHQLLKSLCLFPRETADKIESYHHNGEIWSDMYAMFLTQEPLSKKLPKLPTKFVKTLNERVAHITSQIQSCRNETLQE